MVNSKSIIHTLKDIAVRNLKEAADQLAQSNRLLLNAKNQRDMLHEYRQDYLRRRTDLMTDGMNINNLQNYQNFLSKLDQAITGQESIEKHCADQVRHSLQIWQGYQKKKLSYNVLIGRSEQKIRALEAKKDQKLMDEFTARTKKLSF